MFLKMAKQGKATQNEAFHPKLIITMPENLSFEDSISL
jgi:hypothetical protein